MFLSFISRLKCSPAEHLHLFKLTRGTSSSVQFALYYQCYCLRPGGTGLFGPHPTRSMKTRRSHGQSSLNERKTLHHVVTSASMSRTVWGPAPHEGGACFHTVVPVSHCCLVSKCTYFVSELQLLMWILVLLFTGFVYKNRSSIQHAAGCFYLLLHISLQTDVDSCFFVRVTYESDFCWVVPRFCCCFSNLSSSAVQHVPTQCNAYRKKASLYQTFFMFYFDAFRPRSERIWIRHWSALNELMSRWKKCWLIVLNWLRMEVF